MLPIHSPRLVLRDFKPSDFEAFYATTMNAEYRRFYSAAEMSQEFWHALFQRVIEGAGKPERTLYQLAVCLPEGDLIGTCGVRIEDLDNQQASFGCAIARDYWGGGLALEATRRLFDFAFDQLPVHRIYAEANRENIRARALAERLGMRQEGLLFQHRYFKHRWWDTVIYALLKGEWQPLKT